MQNVLVMSSGTFVKTNHWELPLFSFIKLHLHYDGLIYKSLIIRFSMSTLHDDGCMALVALCRTWRWMDAAACGIIAKYLL
jgi:hypothetical protein